MLWKLFQGRDLCRCLRKSNEFLRMNPAILFSLGTLPRCLDFLPHILQRCWSTVC